MQVPYKSLPWVSAKPSQEIGVCGLWSPSNSRMSAAKYSGTGAQAASANSARSPAASGQTAHLTVRAPPSLIVKHLGHHARGARHTVSPETPPTEGGSSPPNIGALSSHQDCE